MRGARIAASYLCFVAVGAALGCGRIDRSEVVSQQSSALVVSQSVSLAVPSGSDFRATALGANGTLKLGDRAVVSSGASGFGAVSNAGTTLADFGVTSHAGNVVSTSNVLLHDRSIVTGSVTSSSNVTLSNGVVVTGTVKQNVAFPGSDVTAWHITFTQSTQNVVLTAGQSSALAPGAFSHVTVNASAKLTLRSGSYYIDQLDLEPQGTITLDQSNGPIFVYTQSSLIYRGKVTGGTPDKFLLAYLGSQPLSVLESAFNGTLVAPSAPVRLGTGGGIHKGAVFAKDLQLDPDVQFGFVPFSGWASVPLEVTPRFECAESRSDGSKVALFGYVNPSASAVTVPIGAQNQLLPAPADRRQPTTFLTGNASSSFAVRFTGTAPRWSLNGIDATVDASKVCPASVQFLATQDTTVKATTPLASYGADSQLTVASDQFALANFDRAALLAARGTGRFVKSAHLQFSVVGGAATVTARPIRHAWSEAAATWVCASDLDTSATAERCMKANRWLMPLHSGTWNNAYYKSSVSTGIKTASVLDFDVSEDVQRFISADYAAGPIGWLIQASSGGTLLLGSREGGNAARLVVEMITVADTDLAGSVPFGFSIDPTLATSDTLPALADGVPRTLGVLKTSEGQTLRYAERELIVMTDDATQLSAIKTRWNATELALPELASPPLPGLPSPHLLRIDPTKATPATLVPNLRRVVNRPDGLQKVSSNAALGLLSAFAAEQAQGTAVTVNWLIPGTAVTPGGFANKVFVDGTPAPNLNNFETSSNSFLWPPFGAGMHEVNRAWELMYFSGKLKPIIDVAIIDTGFSTSFQDEPNEQAGLCASGSCRNPFSCGGGSPCPWHGVHVANAGFGEPNNQKGGSGPGAGVTNLTLQYGFGDMGTLLLTIPKMIATGQDIVNISAAIPVPDYLFYTTLYAEAELIFARDVAGLLVFAAAGNENANVDEKRCFDLWLFTVCPWEKTTWFPCESGGVDCVGGTNYADKNRWSLSNYGGAVGYWATAVALTGADPDTPIGSQFQPEFGTSESSPFMAGTAALTWAANRNQSPGDVEDCLSSAQVGGPDGRFVNTYLAAACGLGNPPNLAPLVQITNPSTEVATFDQVGPVSLIAEAADYESGKISQIFWSSDVEGVIGSSVPGSSLLYQPSGPGNRTITALATDPQGLTGTDTVVLSFNPAPPAVQILSPKAGQQVFAGLPTDLIARVGNLPGLAPKQPCDTGIWTGFQGNSILFDHLSGCSVQWSFLNPGPHHVNVSMSVDALTGTATQPFTVVDDGQLHVKITNPLKSTDLVAALTLDTPITLSAVSNASGAIVATYSWLVSNRGTVLVSPIAVLSGQSVSYTPTSPTGCGPDVKLRFSVVASDSLGRVANDSLDATAYNACPPK